MAKFLTTRGTAACIEDIINGAKNRLILISSSVQIPESLFQNLEAADARNVKTTLVYGKEELKPEVRNNLKQFRNLELRFLKTLHAKCYHNEESIVITSMNLYDFSEINNKEMGVLLTIEDDKGVFNEAVEEANRIVNSASKKKLISPKVNESPQHTKQKDDRSPSRTKQKGYCIRCGERIPFNHRRPHCSTHWAMWAIYRNRYFEEKLCHMCGREMRSSVAKPLCPLCLAKSKNL